MFRIVAPGRIVLSGKFGAMYGKHVVLASLNCNTKIYFYELSIIERKESIHIEFENVQLLLKIPLEVITNFRSSAHFTELISDHIRFLNLLRSLITLNGMWKTHPQRLSLEIFFFLLMHIAKNEELDIKSFSVTVLTEMKLSIGIGLGNSSSFAVCVSACFLGWARLQKGAYNEFNEQDLISISSYAKLAEKVVLGSVCESDIDVCCYGQIIKSKYNIEEDTYSVDKIDAPEINILLVDLNINLDVDGEAMNLVKQKHEDSENMNKYLNCSDKTSEDICETLVDINNFHKNPDSDPQARKEAYIKLQKLIQQYQDSLTKLDLCRKLDLMIDHAECIECEEHVGTFAGHTGKYAYILLPPHITQKSIKKLKTYLKNKGFNVHENSINGNGVRICTV